MALEKQLTMLKLLLKRTKSGQLEWKETADDKSFQAIFSGVSVLLRQMPARTPQPDYQILIVNEQAAIVESFLDTDFDSEAGAYTIMHELFDLARRKVLGVDRIIDSIINELDGDN